MFLHCAGDAYGFALGNLLESLYGVKVIEHNSFCFMMTDDSSEEALQIDAAQVRKQALRRWKPSEKWFDIGRFHKEMPLTARRESAVEAFAVEGFLKALFQASNWITNL